MGLNWNQVDPPTSAPERVTKAEQEWGQLWALQEAYTPNTTIERLPKLAVTDLGAVLCRFPKGKAGGSDHWQPGELLALPHAYKLGLLRWMVSREQEGVWPHSFNGALIALLDKEGARHEGQLRPICLLPYIYRIWMKLRRPATKDWLQNLYGHGN